MAAAAAWKWQEGRALDYTPGSAKVAGEVVVSGKIVGVVATDLAANQKGALNVQGVFKVTKEATVTVFAAGDPVYFDVADNQANVDSANPYMGVAAYAAGATDGFVYVLLGSVNEENQLRVVNLAAPTQALTAAQSGQKFVGAADAVFTLPAASAATKGVWYEVEVGVLAGAVGISLSPAAADHIRGNGLTAVDNKDLINPVASDRLGDMVRVYCDGVDGWVIDAIIGTWAKEA